MNSAELILTVANSYTMSTRAFAKDPRGSEYSGCVYYDPETKRSCAVGMWIRPELRPEYAKREWYSVSVEGVNRRLDLDSILVPEAQGQSILFWSWMQSLHDDEEYWDDTGLSEAGWDRLDQTLRTYAPEYGR